MLTIRWRWKGKCPRHVRYNPAKDGEGGIKGACPHCRMLFQVFKAHLATLGSASVFDEVQRAGDGIAAVRGAAVRAFGGR